MEDKNIIEKLKFAEESVSVLKNPALREKAFEVILTNLLKGDTKTETLSRSSKRRKVSSTSHVVLPKEVRKSQLSFSEAELNKLKDFYDKFRPSGREMSIFIIANFLRVEVKQSEFHEGDIEYCFQQLINLRTKTKLPTITNLAANIRQTLSWLTAPSRRKQWLQISEETIYGVSPVGIIKFNNLEDKLGSEKSEEQTK